MSDQRMYHISIIVNDIEGETWEDADDLVNTIRDAVDTGGEFINDSDMRRQGDVVVLAAKEVT